MARVLLIFIACLMTQIKCDDYRMQQLLSYSNLNGPCRGPRDCRPFGYVCRDNKTCDCDKNYVPDFYMVQCVGGVDQKCSYDEHCIPGAFCMNQAVCKCKENTPIVLEDGLVCADATKLKSLQWFHCFLVTLVIINV